MPVIAIVLRLESPSTDTNSFNASCHLSSSKFKLYNHYFKTSDSIALSIDHQQMINSRSWSIYRRGPVFASALATFTTFQQPQSISPVFNKVIALAYFALA